MKKSLAPLLITSLSLLACDREDQRTVGSSGGQAIPKPSCASGEINDPLAGHCVQSLGATLPCAEGSFLDAHEWLNDGSRILYIEAGSTGGDGSAKKPLGSLDEALASGDTDVVLMLGKGAHAAPGLITGAERRVRLIGACPAQTRLTGEMKAQQLSGLGLSSLGLDGGLTATDVKSIELHQLIVANPSGPGIQVTGQTVDRFDFWLSDLEETGGDGISGSGAVGWWTIDGANFKGPIAGDGISLVDFGGSQFKFRNGNLGQIEGAGIRGQQALGWWTVDGANFTGPIGADGISIVDFGGSQFDVGNSTFREIAGSAIQAEGALGWWTVDGSNFRGPLGGDGISIVDFGGSQFTVTGGEFAQMAGAGVTAFNSGGAWAIDRNIFTGPIEGDGVQLASMTAGSSLTASENTVTGVNGAGFVLDGGEITATLSGNQISNTGALGMDIANLSAESSVTVSDNRIENATEVALGLEATAAELTLTGNEIVGTHGGDLGGGESISSHGFGIMMLDVGNVSIQENHVAGNRTAGILLDLELWGYYADRSDLVGPARVHLTSNDCEGHHDPETLSETNLVIQNVDAEHEVMVDAQEAPPDNGVALSNESASGYAMKRGRGRRNQTCGDGLRQAWEGCDDGNRENGDGCNRDCQAPACGNGVLDEGEGCDDGNNVPFDDCDNRCELHISRHLAVSNTHMCTLCNQGRVCCRGNNQYGQLGQGNRGTHEGNVIVPGLNHVIEVTTGRHHTCARTRAGAVACWGENNLGQLGDGTDTAAPSPVWVQDANSNPLIGMQRIFAAYDSTCAVKQNGEVSCWGDNRKRQLTTVALRHEFVSTPHVIDSLAGVVDIRHGPAHVCVLDAQGQVHCWGSVEQGAIAGNYGSSSCGGNYGGMCVSTLVEVALPEAYTARALGSGEGFSCAVAGPQDKVFCWGTVKADGRQGHNDPDAGSSPVPVPYGDGYLTGVDSLALGPAQACALLHDRTALCWGLQASGRISTAGNPQQPWLPHPLLRSSEGPGNQSPLQAIRRLELGKAAGCARGGLENPGLYCFGTIHNGNEDETHEFAIQLADGD